MKSNRKYRLNIIITYYEGFDPTNYRTPLIQIFQNIAWLHKLDFATSIEHQFVLDDGLQLSATHSKAVDDIVYLRQSSETRISIKDLRHLIDSLFDLSFLPCLGVEVGYQLQKALGKYPFPKNFLRFLNYPYVEVYKGNHSSLAVFSEAVLPIFGEEQNPSLN